MSLSQVYRIIAFVRAGGDTTSQKGKATTKTARTPAVIASVEALVTSDWRLTVEEMSEELNIPHSTIHRILTEDLHLSKKAAGWVPKLLDKGMKKQRIEASEVFVNHAGGSPEVFLSKIITMDETKVSFYNLETKEQSKQWLRKESLAPTKAKSQASRKKQMVFAFFDDSGSVYEHYASVGTKINGDYIIEVLRKFLRILPRKRPLLAEEGWLLHCDNAPVHTATSVKTFLARRRVEILPHPSYSPDLAPANFWLFPKVKAALAGVRIDSDSVRTEWERVVGGIPTEEFA